MIEADPGLRAELSACAATFGDGDPGDADEGGLWRRRLLEWFVLERPGDGLRVPPLVGLLESATSRPPGDARAQRLLDAAAALRASLVGLFDVTGVEAGRGLWLSDLGARGEYPAAEQHAGELFRKGDLIAGRIYPLEDGSWHVSRAAAFFRSPELRAALVADIERARSQRRGAVRVSQLEIERMFFGAQRRTPQDPVGDARALLLNAGVERDEVERVFDALALEPFDRELVLQGTHDFLAELLDRLAFETSVDLDHARRALTFAWEHLAQKGPGRGATIPRPNTASADVSRALADFERARASGVPLERAFHELETELQLEAETDDDDPSALEPAPDFPGVVGAVVEEFLWERSSVAGEALTSELESLRLLSSFAAPIGVFENLGQRDLLAYTCHWLPESDALPSADAARAHVGALSRFCRWVEETHGLPLHSQFKPTLNGLQNSLPRLVEANRRRTRASDPATGELYECLAVDGTRARLRDRAGNERSVDLDPDLASWLRAGDHLRARAHDDGRAAVYCCYPPEARGLVAR